MTFGPRLPTPDDVCDAYSRLWDAIASDDRTPAEVGQAQLEADATMSAFAHAEREASL